MYSVKIRKSVMIAHSLPDPFFGPAQGLHGATYVVDVTFKSQELNPQNVVIDIGKAHEVLAEVLAPISYKNLDALEQFKGQLTTTEFVAKHIHDQVAEKATHFFKGKIEVLLGETHDAWAGYAG